MSFVTEAFAMAGPQGAAGATPSGTDMLLQFLPLILMFVIFWFLLIRPQQKRQKEHMKMCESLARGDEVMTLGGLSGRIESVDDQTIALQVASVDGKAVVVRMQRASVQMVLPKGSLKF